MSKYLVIYVFNCIYTRNTQRTRMLGYVRMHMPKTRSGLALRIVLVSRAPKDCESRVNWQRLEALQVQGCSVGVIFGSNRVINLQQWGNFKNSSSGVV